MIRHDSQREETICAESFCGGSKERHSKLLTRGTCAELANHKRFCAERRFHERVSFCVEWDKNSEIATVDEIQNIGTISAISIRQQGLTQKPEEEKRNEQT